MTEGYAWRRQCQFQPWLAGTPIISTVAPHLSFALFCQPNTGTSVSLTRPNNCLKELVTTQLLLSRGFSSPQLGISIMSSGLQTTGSCLDMVCTYLVQFSFSWNNGGCGFLSSSILTAHLSDNLYGHLIVIFEQPTCYDCVSCVAYSEPSVGLLFALHGQHQCISIG